MTTYLSRLKYTHVRFEPEVDGGTTYAFNFSFSELVIGRMRMYRLVEAIGTTGREIESLFPELVEEGGSSEAAYPDPASLLVDVMRLVNAHVLAASGEMPAGAKGPA